MHIYKTFVLLMGLSLIRYGLTQLEARKTEKFEAEFVKFVNDALGVAKFQDYLDKNVSFSTNTFNGSAVLDEIVDAMYTEYKNKVDLVEDLANHLTSVYNEVDDEGPIEDILFAACCTDNPESTYQTWDAQLNQNVNMDMCVHGRGLKTNSRVEILPNAVKEKWKKVFDDEHENGVQWIFYGNEEGILYNYPAVQMCQESYDPRHRPFYIETVTPVPKDIVIVIDRTGSMGEWHNSRLLMTIAQEAASTVIDTLNIHDRVGVVSFSTTAITPPGTSQTNDCYATSVARATPENKSYLRNFVYSIQIDKRDHITNYTAGLEAAFGLLKNTPDIRFDNRERSNVIMFLTDGKPDDNESPVDPDEPGNAYEFGGYIYQNISKMNSELQNPVILLTYGLGENIGDKAKKILEDMANQVISEPEVTGNFVHVVEPDNLRREMTSYYNLFTRGGGSNETHFTAPYQDNFGSGVVAAICKSVNKGEILKGVICIDQTLEKLLSEMMYRQTAESSYFFMVDIYARVFDHPYAQNPTEITNHPKFIYLDVLEIGDRIDEMISSIVDQVNGNLTTTTKRIISSGDPNLDSVIYHSDEIYYVWKMVPGTKYVIGLATIAFEKDASITWIDELPQYFTYHKVFEDNNYPERCLHDRKAVIKDDVGVQFALRAFEVPYKFYVKLEDKTMVQSFRDYFTRGTENVDIGFKAQIREYYAAMSHFRNITLEANEIWKDDIQWRFLATKNGIFFNFPATEFPKKYDPTRESWYPLAKANKENIVATRPNQDSDGRGAVTIAKAIFEGKDVHDPANDVVIGVMGMNLYHQNIHEMLIKHIPDCISDGNSCFLMDTSGFIITHPNWMSSSFVGANIPIHLAKMEPYIARELIQTSHLKSSMCLNVTGLRHQYSWHININNNMADQNTFEMHQIAGTNMLLVIKQSGPRGQECFNCEYQDYKLCNTTIGQSECFCPCYAYDQDNYQYCEDTFSFTSDDVPICPAPLLKIDSRQLMSSEYSLKPCYILDCDDYFSKGTCRQNDKCEWTTKCQKKEKCSRESGETLSKDCLKEKGIPNWAIALIVLGILLLLIFGLCVIYQIIMRVYQLKKRTSCPDDSAVYDEMSGIGHDNEYAEFGAGEYLNISTLKSATGNTVKPSIIQPDLTKEARHVNGSDDAIREEGCRHASGDDIADGKNSQMILDQELYLRPAALPTNKMERDGQILSTMPDVRAQPVNCNLNQLTSSYLTMESIKQEDTNEYEICYSKPKDY